MSFKSQRFFSKFRSCPKIGGLYHLPSRTEQNLDLDSRAQRNRAPNRWMKSSQAISARLVDEKCCLLIYRSTPFCPVIFSAVVRSVSSVETLNWIITSVKCVCLTFLPSTNSFLQFQNTSRIPLKFHSIFLRHISLCTQQKLPEHNFCHIQQRNFQRLVKMESIKLFDLKMIRKSLSDMS